MNALVNFERALMAGEPRFGAADCPDWLNCGPGALCAALGTVPSEIEPHLLDFKAKGYTNPTLMLDTLDRLGVEHRIVFRSDDPGAKAVFPRLGVVRIQWGGRWTEPGVPMRVRYRQTHWIAVRRIRQGKELLFREDEEWFDINYIHHGGWMKRRVWEDQMSEWIIKELVGDGKNGLWWRLTVLRWEGSYDDNEEGDVCGRGRAGAEILRGEWDSDA